MNPWFLSTSLQASLQMVLMDQGIGFLPDLPSPATRKLVRLLPDEVGAEGDVFVIMGQRLRDSQRGRRMRQLIERARRYLQQVDG